MSGHDVCLCLNIQWKRHPNIVAQVIPSESCLIFTYAVKGFFFLLGCPKLMQVCVFPGRVPTDDTALGGFCLCVLMVQTI